jgi:hypothetical protein
MRFALVTAILLATVPPLAAQATPDSAALQRSVNDLRRSIGRWNVTTEFLAPDGSVARSVTGTYEFAWVVPNRVVSGKSDIPEMRQVSGILFYVNEVKQVIEMVAVGGDGNLWVMTGPLGGNTRRSQEYTARDGGTGQLRFTTYNVTDDAFESKMEYTSDGGTSPSAGSTATTWWPGRPPWASPAPTTSRSPSSPRHRPPEPVPAGAAAYIEA